LVHKRLIFLLFCAHHQESRPVLGHNLGTVEHSRSSEAAFERSQIQLARFDLRFGGGANVVKIGTRTERYS
jgi:hypothetical protein